MFRFFAVIIMFTLLLSCSSNGSAASKSDVYSWGIVTLDDLIKIYPTSFQAMSSGALIPDDLDFSKLNANYDKNSNMQISLDRVDIEFLRNAGIISSVSEHCNLDWAEKNFLPMMQWQRQQVPSSERNGYQIAVVGFIHGFAQGRTDEWLLENNAKCEQVRTVLKDHLFDDKF